ncbi:MAG TPA: c-type cytochrome, partial [Verrucomicrobium sp.]|nr:c-type cytochrome [Verrucomicrobium sp.]
PPRNDEAQSVTWNFAEQKRAWQDQQTVFPKVRLELIDGDSGTTYAWLAAGRFEPAVVRLPDDDPQTLNGRIAALASLVRDFPTDEGLAHLQALPQKLSLQPKTRLALAEAITVRQPNLQSLAILARESDLGPVVFALLESPAQSAKLLAGVFKDQPYRTQVKLATAMAATPEQSAQLLKLAPPRVLADPLVTGKLKALNHADITRQLEELTRSVPQVDEGLNQLIKDRLAGFASKGGNAPQGEQLFQTHCAVCHRIGVRGNLVGPQLDGVGARGVERLLEDILDPNRAVDPAFRMHFVKLNNGEVTGGLLRREQDDALIIADVAGQEHAVKKSEIAEHQESPFSLMPAGMNDLLAGQPLNDLLAYLLERKQ